MSQSASSPDDGLVRSALIDATVTDMPWEVSFSKHPLHPVETVTFESDGVGVLTHYVRVRPRVNGPTNSLHGYRVEKFHQNQEDPTVVEEVADTFEDALREAKDCIDRLTN